MNEKDIHAQILGYSSYFSAPGYVQAAIDAEAHKSWMWPTSEVREP
ncbi:hypothetical protein [Mycobacterium phage WXIN]|nr:hypothetical protein [Mycobacterium phage WXIN]